MFEIHLGIPEMEELWNRLENRHQNGSAAKAEEKLRRQMGKAMALLSGNPRHPGLHSHEITSLTARYGQRVWESAPQLCTIINCQPYLSLNTPNSFAYHAVQICLDRQTGFRQIAEQIYAKQPNASAIMPQSL